MKKTKCYKFKEVDLVSLRELALKVKSQTGFRLRYGGLLTLLRTDVDEKLVHTLVQFYDPSFRCFTFPDFQLVPTLEAYSNLVGLPIAEKTPFTGPGTSLTPLVIAKDLYLKTSDVSNHLTTKSHIRGFTSKYLLDQANLGTTRQDTLEAILALLIYGLVLFPNLDDFVDMNAIEIFHSKNPVPTLLADTYHAIHDRTLKGQFFFYTNAPTGQRKAFMDAWSKVRRKSVKHLGVRSGVAHEAYTQWVIDRAEEIGMPYPAMRYVSSSTPSMPLPLLPATQDMYQEHLAMESREKQVWKARYDQAENLIMNLDGRDEQKTHENLMLKKELAKARRELEEKDELLMRDSKRARGRRDFFDRYCDSDSESDGAPTTSYA
ncbi:hypothetical protein MtrunA17_Chr4g0006651 [Medicago truncatula]|uniref:DUF7745 domain-containing protein n=1 Tax=Medicago truncatula TaxID=3880 RepID=A0A396HZQ4_MEDTR|nr:hypothetical protein MtrunA17_Chr4g0006651 [Medicago truncatula]